MHRIVRFSRHNSYFLRRCLQRDFYAAFHRVSTKSFDKYEVLFVTKLSLREFSTEVAADGALNPPKKVLPWLVSLDITNTPFAHSKPKLMEQLDEAIMHFISMDACPLESLQELLERDQNCPLTHFMIFFQYLRRGRFTAIEGRPNDALLAHSLKKLFILRQSSSPLPSRETLLLSAAELWMNGEYSAAGNTFEKILSEYPTDLLAIRLAQDSYLCAGDSYNALRCSLRSSYAFTDKHILYGYYLGMLTTGYFEDGKFTEAEEFGLRAVEKCRGQDFSGLRALMNVYLMQGRSSEVTGLLDRHEHKHERSSALIECSYAKARAFIHKGNYKGALRQLEGMFDDLVDGLENDPELLTLLSILIWTVQINSIDNNLTTYWRRLSDLWAGLPCEERLLSPLHSLAASLSHQSAAHYRYQDAQSTIIDDIEVEEGAQILKKKAPATSISIFGTFFQSTKSNTSVSGDLKPHFTRKEAASSTADESLEQRRFEERSNAYQAQLLSLAETMRADGTNVGGESSPLRIPEAPTNCSERLWLLNSTVLPLSAALAAFAREDYSDAYFRLEKHRKIWPRVGGSLLARDLFDQTLIEAALRSEKLKEARRLLSERTSLIPNDSQSWRRLASVLGRLGSADEARDANYTAWQLGIGQGGFGGPT